ncbi:reverse transcriptase family protein [Paenibacillus sp. IHBB 10380]|uniref:reverse transcriptase family protein n=1 Tax=Paenibacillus sp. IHBB 10380 TaxID=1566358 RepID=UPI000698FB63|nr:reverse transcriptase family protein [Paenibacillus sp. IHBB 10380]
MIDYTVCTLYGVKNKKYLSELLKIELFKLKEIEKYYITLPFSKKMGNNKIRLLYNPSKEYKDILKRLNYFLQKIVLPDYVFGGIKKRDYIQNASKHKDNKFFLIIDLKDFFPSTSDTYVYNFFKNKLNMSIDVAKICTLLVTEQSEINTRYLPQGYSTSPILSYLCYFEMFNSINSLSINNNITYSCYYDDNTFSSKNIIIKDFKNKIVEIIKSYNLQVNPKKTILLKNTKGVRITGTIVNNNILSAPNPLQGKMYINFNKLVNSDLTDMNEAKNIIKLCNIVQGCSSAIKSIERQRKFPHILKKVKEIRSLIK